MPLNPYHIAGHTTVVASLYADGMIYLHDTVGEEILAFDSGHGVQPVSARDLTEPVVSGLSADASEGDPVLLTAGTDGTVRIYALTVYVHGRRIAGRSGTGGDASRIKQRDKKRGESSDAGDVEQAAQSQNNGRDEAVTLSSTAPRRKTPQIGTTPSIEIAADFRVCIGSACPGQSVAAGDAYPSADGVSIDNDARAPTASRSDERRITSLTAFYHRA